MIGKVGATCFLRLWLSVNIISCGNAGNSSPPEVTRSRVIPHLLPATTPYTDIIDTFSLVVTTGDRLHGRSL